ncbi:MAG: hypothetical protein ACK4JF_03660, partial [Methylohalobius sp.]
GSMAWGEALRHGAFQALSILTTTGFATFDYTEWPVGAQAILGLPDQAGLWQLLSGLRAQLAQ